MRALPAQKAVAAAEAQHSRSKWLPAFAFPPCNLGLGTGEGNHASGRAVGLVGEIQSAFCTKI